MRDFRGSVIERSVPNARPTDPWAARLLRRRRIDETTGCWEWTGYTIPSGYGEIASRTEHWLVHRLAAHLWLGFEPAGEMCVLHRCDNPPCFNPEHLFIGTRGDNVQDMLAKGRARPARGAANRRTKLTADQVRAIRIGLAAGISNTRLASQIGVGSSAIQSIRSGRTWAHLA